MKKEKFDCETCSIRGYSYELCKMHKMHQKKDTEDDSEESESSSTLKKVGKTAAIGAGLGVCAATLGMAAVPVVGIKTVLVGHALAYKLAVGGGAAGAGANLVKNARKRKERTKKEKKKQILLPKYLKGK